MWRWVIKDYFSAFSWYKIREVMKPGNLFWIFYWLVVLPGLSGAFEEMDKVWTFYLMMLPVGFCTVSGVFHRSKLPKFFYICPMERSVRRTYINRKFLFAILVPAFIGGVATILLLGLRLCHPLTAGLYFFDMLVISLFGGDIFTQTVEVPKDSAIQVEEVNMLGVTKGVAFVLSFLGILGMWMMLDIGPAVESWCKWVFFSVAVVIVLPLTIKGLTGWNAAVERALSYEVVKIKAKKVGGK